MKKFAGNKTVVQIHEQCKAQHADWRRIRGGRMNITHAEFSAAQRLPNVAGSTYSLQEMLAANRDDEALCDWLRQAEPGDEFRDGEGCACVAPEAGAA